MELWVRGTYISASSSPVLVSSEGIRVRPRLGEEASVTCSGREESGQNLVCMSQQLFNSPLQQAPRTQGFASETDGSAGQIA